MNEEWEAICWPQGGVLTRGTEEYCREYANNHRTIGTGHIVRKIRYTKWQNQR